MNFITNTIYIFLFCCFSFAADGQKQINHQSLFWLASVNAIRINPRWEVVADFHYRTFDFMSHPYTYIARGSGNYYLNDNLKSGIGYGHMWNGPFIPDAQFSNEHRITEQVQSNSRIGELSISNRWRLEQRWQQKVINNEKTSDYRFTNRFRYAINFIYSPFKNKRLPSFTNYDEMMLQFGKEVIYNVFDQVRLSVGIRQTLTSRLNVDLNYMYLFQQQFTGDQYVQGNALRLFINYYIDLKKNRNRENKPPLIFEEE